MKFFFQYRIDRNNLAINFLLVKFNKLRFLLLIMLSAIIAPVINAQVVKQPVSDLSTTIKKYNYTYKISESQEKVIRYIIVKASTGDIKSTFDACDVCYAYNKGYSQKNNQLICNNCGNKFNIDDLGTQGSGGCWPGHLIHTTDADNVIINVSDLVNGAYYFPAQTISDVYENTSNDIPNSLSIFNNNNDLIIKLQNTGQRNFRIFSLNGFIHKSVSNSEKELSLNISDLSSGIYILSVEESGKKTSKFFNICK